MTNIFNISRTSSFKLKLTYVVDLKQSFRMCLISIENISTENRHYLVSYRHLSS